MSFIPALGALITGTTVATTGATAAQIGVGLLATGGLAFGAKSILGSVLPDTSVPSLPPLPQAPSQAEAQKKSRTEALAEQRERLRGSRTTLTGPQGGLLSPINVAGKTLLGA